MSFYGKAEAAVDKIVKAFEDTNSLPKPLAKVFICRKDNPHYRRWSWGNQLLVILHGFTDARGFRQWEQVERKVKKGEKAFYILGPLTKKVKSNDPVLTVLGLEEAKLVVVGFKG